jgi:hypothetical protein
MSRELDRRDFSVNKVTPTRECELHTMASDVSASLPGSHRVQIARFGRHRQTQRDLLRIRTSREGQLYSAGSGSSAEHQPGAGRMCRISKSYAYTIDSDAARKPRSVGVYALMASQRLGLAELTG